MAKVNPYQINDRYNVVTCYSSNTKLYHIFYMYTLTIHQNYGNIYIFYVLV